MKYVFISLALFLSSCASDTIRSKNLPIQYGQLQKLNVGTSSEKDVIESLGIPSSRVEKNGYYTFVYNDPENDFQRLSVNFLSSNQKMSGLLWIPRENEKEFSLKEAKAGFRSANFKEIISESKNPHVMSHTISYVDENSGITIRFDQVRNQVEGIAIYDTSAREPASEKPLEAPFTF